MHGVDAFCVYVFDDFIDLIEIRQCDVELLGYQVVLTLSSPIVAYFLCADSILGNAGLDEGLSQALFDFRQGYFRVIVFRFGVAVKFFFKVSQYLYPIV